MDIMIYINDYINNLYKRLLLTFRNSQHMIKNILGFLFLNSLK